MYNNCLNFTRFFFQNVSTSHLSKELGLDYGNLLKWRHKIQETAWENRINTLITDMEVESDEVFQNAGEKGTKHNDPTDPPRKRANKKVGIGTWNNDRPPIHGVVGRENGRIRLEVCKNTQQKTIGLSCDTKLYNGSILYTDESNAYNKQGEKQKEHHTVCHSKKEFARDRNNDGIYETHCNTMEGIWTGLRNFLRPFRGVHKRLMAQYVAVFEWTHNFKELTAELFRTFLIPDYTVLPI